MRIGESANDYPHVVADFGDGIRVIECNAGIQWVIQRRVRKTGAHCWEGRYFCRTKWALGHYSGRGDHPAIAVLPDRFPEKARQTAPEPCHGDFPVAPLSDIGVPPERAVAIPVCSEGTSFDRLWAWDGVLSDWKPTNGWADTPDIPDFLRRVA